MKVSISWLKDIVDLKVPIDEVIRLLPLRTIGLQEVTPDYFELDMKGYNRADLLSLRGVAYEVAAITDSSVKFDETPEDEYIWVGKNLPEIDVEIEDPNLCPVYCLAKIEGLEATPSSGDWIKALANCGMRSVNTVVDVTNLIMLGFGQPLHAFDADTVKNEKIIVRTAKPAEKLITLDNKTRTLETSDLVIADPEKALGLAGVMGGKNSEISDKVPLTILLEAAIFDPTTLRKTATKLGLQSEASKRFQHGLTKKRLLQALDEAIRMLGGELTAITLKGYLKDPVKKITLRQEKLNSLVGIDFKPEEVENYLKKLGFILATKDQVFCGWEVEVPYFRLDVGIEEDVIEEVARMYGYEKIPAKPLPGQLPAPIDQKLFDLIYNLKKTLVNLGLTELQTYSFYSARVINNLNIDKDNLVKIANPISSETEYMRSELWPNLLEKTADNLKQGFEEIAVFEIGKVYQPQKGELPKEEYKLSIALSDDSKNTTQKLYSIIQNLTSHIGGGKLVFQQTEMNENEKQLFHPVRFGKLVIDEKEIGFLAEIHPRITNKFGVGKRVAVLEINISSL